MTVRPAQRLPRTALLPVPLPRQDVLRFSRLTTSSAPRPLVRLRVVALALGIGALWVWWPRLMPTREAIPVATGVLEIRSDRDIDGDIVRVAEEAARRVHQAGLEIPDRQLVLLCQSRACWRANVPPRWARATTRLLDGLIVLSPYVPLGPVPALSQPAPWWRPAYWALPASRHECAVRVLTHELAHVAHIRQRGRLRTWRSGAPDAEAFASRIARTTARADSALTHYECAGAEG